MSGHEVRPRVHLTTGQRMLTVRLSHLLTTLALGAILFSSLALTPALSGEVLRQDGVLELAAQPHAPSVSFPTSFVPPPPGGELTDVALPAGTETACECCDQVDWVVSTRCSQQDWCESGGRGFVVYKRINCGCLQRSSMNEMRASLSPNIPTAVFVHGSFVTLDSFVQESCWTSKWLRSCRRGCPLQTVFFTWPSDQNARYLPGSVRELTRRAEFNAFYLADLLACLPCDCRAGGRLSVMGHSHGGLMTAAAMHLLGGGMIQGRCSRARLRWRADVVLAAAAMDRDWLSPKIKSRSRALTSLRQVADRGRYDRAMSVVNRMLILKNRHDLALKVYPARRLFAKQAIGKAGLSRRDEQRLGAAACRIRTVDVSHLLGCRHVWPHYLRERDIACAAAPYLFGR